MSRPLSDAEMAERLRSQMIEAALAGPLRLQTGKTRVMQFVGTVQNPLVQQILSNGSARVAMISVATVPGNPFAIATFSQSSTPSPGSDPQNDFAVVPRFPAIVVPGETLYVACSVATRLAITEVWF